MKLSKKFSDWISLIATMVGVQGLLLFAKAPIVFILLFPVGMTFSIIAIVMEDNPHRKLGIAGLVLNILGFFFFLGFQAWFALYVMRT